MTNIETVTYSFKNIENYVRLLKRQGNNADNYCHHYKNVINFTKQIIISRLDNLVYLISHNRLSSLTSLYSKINNAYVFTEIDCGQQLNCTARLVYHTSSDISSTKTL